MRSRRDGAVLLVYLEDDERDRIDDGEVVYFQVEADVDTVELRRHVPRSVRRDRGSRGPG